MFLFSLHRRATFKEFDLVSPFAMFLHENENKVQTHWEVRRSYFSGRFDPSLCFTDIELVSFSVISSFFRGWLIATKSLLGSTKPHILDSNSPFRPYSLVWDRCVSESATIERGGPSFTCCSSSAAEPGCSDRILKDYGSQTWSTGPGTAAQLDMEQRTLGNIFARTFG